MSGPRLVVHQGGNPMPEAVMAVKEARAEVVAMAVLTVLGRRVYPGDKGSSEISLCGIAERATCSEAEAVQALRRLRDSARINFFSIERVSSTYSLVWFGLMPETTAGEALR